MNEDCGTLVAHDYFEIISRLSRGMLMKAVVHRFGS